MFCSTSDTSVETVSASLSTQYKTCRADLAIDGNRVSNDYLKCAHSLEIQQVNFWQAEFAQYTAVRRVTLYFRTGCCKYIYASS